MAKITLIAAIGDNRVIGDNGHLAWSCKNDMAWFKANTLGKPVIMGRRTYKSLPKPLIDRVNIVVSSEMDSQAVPAGVVVIRSLNEAIRFATNNTPEVMIIGGGQIYRQTIDLADEMLITHVFEDLEGTTLFPVIRPSQWEREELERHRDSASGYYYGFYRYTRRKG